MVKLSFCAICKSSCPTNLISKGENMRKLFAILFCTTFLVAGKVPTAPITSAIRANVTAAQVEKAINDAAKELKWISRSTGAGNIEAQLFVRKHELVVDISYTKTEYTIKYKSSKNLNYDEKKQTIHGKYAEWVRNLDVRIQMKLAGL
jgi:Fe-S-cluster-containing dehydrogenase component